MVDAPSRPALNGFVDVVTSLIVAGWVRDLMDPTRRLELHLVQAGVVSAVARADMSRLDLIQAGIGDGHYAFQFEAISPQHPLTPGPAVIRDTLTGAIIPGGTITIPGPAAPVAEPEPSPAPPPPRLQGAVDQVAHNMIAGWVRDIADPDAPLELHLMQDGQMIGAAIADEPREAAPDEPPCGFTLHDLLADPPWKPGPASIHDARTGDVIPGGAITLPAEPATAVFAWPDVSTPAPMAEFATDTPAPPEPVAPEPVAPGPPIAEPAAREPIAPEPAAPEPAAPEPFSPAEPQPPVARPQLFELPTPPRNIPADALRGLLPAENAMKVFAIELALQAYDAPPEPPAPGPFSLADATVYFAMVRRCRPRLVVEFGPGAGTPYAQAALLANGHGALRRAVEPISDLPGGWLAAHVAPGDMVVLNPGLDAAIVLDIMQRLLPACPEGVHVHLHGADALDVLPEWQRERQLSVLFATEWHAAHNPAGLDALLRGRPAGGGASIWLLHRPGH